MLESKEFRELLIADIALVRGVASARDVAAALQRYWEERDHRAASLADELAHIARVDRDALTPVEDEVDRLISSAGGNAEKAFTRQGGLDRSIHVALSQRSAGASRSLTDVGAAVRAPLRTVTQDHYIDFLQAGEGGMGVVYATYDTELNRLVALKMVRPDGGVGDLDALPTMPADAALPPEGSPERRAYEELEARFLQEAWVTGGMEHPGVVPVHELGRTECGIPYYTMRFLRGQRTLKDAIEERRGEPIERRLELLEPFLRVCDTLAYAHAKGVLHRDLKPEHVVLGQYGEVVVIDWGLARLEGRADVTGSMWQERVLELREGGRPADPGRRDGHARLHVTGGGSREDRRDRCPE